MFKGIFPSSIFFKLTFYLVMGSLFLIYWLSQLLGHEKPFPQSWISQCARNYPEYIFFRISTISGSTLMALGWFVNYFYLKTISKEKAFKIQKYLPEIPLVLGVIASIALMSSTANIDTGLANQTWHTRSASFFFVFTFFAQIYNTILGWAVYFDIKTINKTVLVIKTIFAILMIVQLYISSYYGCNEEECNRISNNNDFFSNLGILLEWTFSVTVFSGFYLMSLDVNGFQFVYDLSSQNQLEQK